MLPFLRSPDAAETMTKLTVQDGNCWQHSLAAYLLHPLLGFPSSKLPVELRNLQPNPFEFIETTHETRIRLPSKAVKFLRNQAASLLRQCKEVVVIEGD